MKAIGFHVSFLLLEIYILNKCIQDLDVGKLYLMLNEKVHHFKTVTN